VSKEERSGRKALLREAWFDRDLSWLEFNRRVLSEALDDRTPLLERLKFLAIFTSNLDEFFMKRVGAMRTRAYASRNPVSVDQFHDHMVSLRAALFPMLVEQARCFVRLRPMLAERGIRLAGWQDLSDAQRQQLKSNHGAVLRLIVNDTPAFRADFLPGDIVVAVNDAPTYNSAELHRQLEANAGKTITLTIVRDEQRISKSVTLAQY